MGKYTADDNRSMQLNPNNDRYGSSRGWGDDDMDECDYKDLLEKIRGYRLDQKIDYTEYGFTKDKWESEQWEWQRIHEWWPYDKQLLESLIKDQYNRSKRRTW